VPAVAATAGTLIYAARPSSERLRGRGRIGTNAPHLYRRRHYPHPSRRV